MYTRLIVFSNTIHTCNRSCNRDSVVGYKLDDQGIVVRFPAGSGDFFSKAFRGALEPMDLPMQ